MEHFREKQKKDKTSSSEKEEKFVKAVTHLAHASALQNKTTTKNP